MNIWDKALVYLLFLYEVTYQTDPGSEVELKPCITLKIKKKLKWLEFAGQETRNEGLAWVCKVYKSQMGDFWTFMVMAGLFRHRVRFHESYQRTPVGSWLWGWKVNRDTKGCVFPGTLKLQASHSEITSLTTSGFRLQLKKSYSLKVRCKVILLIKLKIQYINECY